MNVKYEVVRIQRKSPRMSSLQWHPIRSIVSFIGTLVKSETILKLTIMSRVLIRTEQKTWTDSIEILTWCGEWPKVKVISWPIVSQPVCPGIRPPSGTHNQFFFFLLPWKICSDILPFSSCGAPSLTRGRVCNLSIQLLLGLVSTVTRVQILQDLWPYLAVSFEAGFPFCHLLWLEGLHLRYSILPPHRNTGPSGRWGSQWCLNWVLMAHQVCGSSTTHKV
jgi:hypothetical protein